MKNIGMSTWHEINSFWIQKTFIGKNGNPILTYHYKHKSCKPCMVFEINTKVSRTLSGYVLIEKDLRDAYTLLEEHIRIFNSTSANESKILLKGLMKAIAISYGKCFTQACGRKVTLNEKVISHENFESHSALMKLRHEYVAHAGISEYETCKTVFLLTPEKKYIKQLAPLVCLTTELYQMITSTDFLERFKPLIVELLAYAANKIQSLKEILLLEMDKIYPDLLYKLSKKINHRITLNEEDLLRMKNDSCI